MVWMIGIAKFHFDNGDSNLSNDRNNIQKLINLWRKHYNYDVFVCKPESLDCSKEDIIDFVDECTKRLSEGAYNGVIVHIISHGSKGDYFISSDNQQISLDFIKHEVINETGNEDLVKVIFYHACRGNTDLHLTGNKPEEFQSHQDDSHNSCCRLCRKSDDKYLDYEPPSNGIEMVTGYSKDSITKASVSSRKWSDVSRSKPERKNTAAESNLIVIYGNIDNSTVSSAGYFTQCIYDTFKGNVAKWIKKDFLSLIIKIGWDLEEKTEQAEICTISGAIRYKQIRMERMKSYETILTEEKYETYGDNDDENKKMDLKIRIGREISLNTRRDDVGGITPMDNNNNNISDYDCIERQNDEVSLDEKDQGMLEDILEEVESSILPIKSQMQKPIVSETVDNL